MPKRKIILQDLPLEILVDILQCDAISFVDICNFACVSKGFQSVTSINSVWHAKYAKKWPSLALEYDEFKTDWKHEFRIRFNCKKAVLQQLKSVSAECFYKDCVSSEDACCLQKVYPFHPLSLQIIIDTLSEIVNDGERHSNLTAKYYAEKCMHYLRHIYLGKIWNNLLANDRKNFTLLKGAILISQWCQPTDIKCTSNVLTGINKIIKLVYEEVKKRSPQHPLLKEDVPLLLDEYQEALSHSRWSAPECRVILYAISHVMFDEMEFVANVDFLDISGKTFIDKVLIGRVGKPISLCIIYEAVAVQMGVAVSPVILPAKFSLKWCNKSSISGSEECFYMNVFEKGKFISSEKLVDTFSHSDGKVSYAEAHPNRKVFASICCNLSVLAPCDGEARSISLELCDPLELLTILTPHDINYKRQLVRQYYHLGMNLPRVMQLLQEIQGLDPSSTNYAGYIYHEVVTREEIARSKSEELKKKCQSRSEESNVAFTVGMIMVHKKYMYRCVIYGWDGKCEASRNWISQMDVSSLEHKEFQPFYHVLGDDGTNRYAAQENLEFDEASEPIRHPEIGRYFDTFCGHYYQPNAQKLKEYPDDLAILENILESDRNDSCNSRIGQKRKLSPR